eukprot:1515912-Rhodomonas_salina.5
MDARWIVDREAVPTRGWVVCDGRSSTLTKRFALRGCQLEMVKQKQHWERAGELQHGVIPDLENELRDVRAQQDEKDDAMLSGQLHLSLSLSVSLVLQTMLLPSHSFSV